MNLTHKLIYLILVILACVCASCKDEIDTPSLPDNQVEGYYFIISTPGSQSRVSYTDEKKSSFEEGDEIGAFALNSNGTAVAGEKQNAHYRVKNVPNISGNARQVLEPINEADRLGQGHSRYLFYYPYSADIKTLADMTAYSHTVALDQNSYAAYEQSDLLWDVAEPDAAQNCVNIAMDHAMAQIIVQIDEEFIDATKGAILSNVNTTAEKIDLRTESIENLTYTPKNADQVNMWNFGYASSGALMFRAMVAANCTLSAGTTLLSITTAEGGDTKNYKLKEDLTLKPGKNYIFSLKKNTVLLPEIEDTDSWVLDVLDPETGEPVGLLCREYLHYVDPLKITQNGEPFTGTKYGDTKTVNSQAWVFYNLKPGTDIPELNTGIAMQFLYDIDLEDFGYTQRWPLPHLCYQKGAFRPRHGWQWGRDSGSEFGGTEQQYYMHGGTVIWDGVNNAIQYFQLPTEQITNQQAANAFISINRETGEASVSYDDYNSAVEKQGLIVPHMLIDRRANKSTGVIEIRKYPLVKIGYNQFWMSMSLRAQSFCDGTPLTCYNKKGEAAVSFGEREWLGAGYIFPFVEENGIVYDPYNKAEQRKHPESSFTATRLYNKPAVDNPKFTPESPDENTYYVLPGEKEINNLLKYTNPFFGAKLATKHYATRTADNGYAYGKLETSMKGECGQIFRDGNECNIYTANISGLNLRALGILDPASSIKYCSGVNGRGSLMLNTANDPAHVYFFTFQNYQPFSASTVDALRKEKYQAVEYRITQTFCQVRFLMKFRQQADTQGRAAAVASRSEDKVPSRNVYVSLTDE